MVASRLVLNVEDGGKIKLAWMDKEEARRAITAIYNAMKSIAVEPPTLIKKRHMYSEEITLNKPREFVVRSAAVWPRRDV